MPVSPKYRHLTAEELNSLEKEFIEYLVVNGITADDWTRLKEEEKEKAEDILTLFSDVVFEGVMRKVLFLDFISKSELRTFQCLNEKIIMVGMRTSDPDHDFTDSSFIRKAAQNPPRSLEVFNSEKPYGKPREQELFEMTEAGCQISDGKLFKVLSVSLV